MNQRRTLPTTESDEVVRELRAVAPVLARTLDHAQSITVDQLETQPAYPGVPFFAVTMIIGHRPVTHLCARTSSGLVRIGDPNSLVELNRLIGMRCDSPDSIARYLPTWFQLVGPKTEWIVESAVQFEWTAAAANDPELRAVAEQAATLVHPMRITEIEPGRFRVAATIMHQQTLQNRTLEVFDDGTVTDVSSTNLLTRVPVPFVLR